MRPIRSWAARRVAVLAAVAALLLTTALGTAVADDPDTITTRLEPGLNFVGWVGPETPVAELFAAVPEIEVVYAWDAGQQEWLWASPAAPESLHSLDTLTTGMGLALRIDSPDAVEWSRQFVLGSGFVWLARGFNLAPWVGADEDPIESARLDIRFSFLGAHVWDSALSRYRAYDPEMPATAEALPAIDLGDALWIEVGEGSDGYWMQRSDALSQIRGTLTGPDGAPLVDFGVTAIALDNNDNWFYGFTGSDGSFLISVRTDVPYILRFHHDGKPGCWLYYKDGVATKAGDTATPLRATPAVPPHVTFHVPEAACGWEIRGRLVNANGSPLAGRTITASPLDSPGKRGANTAPDGSFVVLTDRNGPHRLRIDLDEDCGFYYQDGGITLWASTASPIQIADAHVDGVTIAVPSDTCRWWIHGSAVDSQGRPLAGMTVATWGNRTLHRAAPIAEDGSFSVAAPRNGSYQLAVHLDAECWVFHHPDGAVSSYDEAWSVQVADADVANVRFVAPSQRCGREIRGKLVDAEGSPLAGRTITASSLALSGARSTKTATDGSFVVLTDGNGPHQLHVGLSDDCQFYYQNGGITFDAAAASPIQITDTHVDGVTISVPANTCRWRIRGTAVDYDNVPLSGSQVRAYGDDGIQSYSDIGADGSFSITVPNSGSYRLGVWFDNECYVYYHPSAAVSFLDDASLLHVVNADVTGVRIVAPERRCGWTIEGTISHADGTPITSMTNSRSISAETIGDVDWSGTIDKNGAFKVKVPTDGSYRLRIWLNDQCAVFYRSDEATAEYDLADLVEVKGDNVTGLQITVPDRICGWRITGRVIDSDGNAVGDSAHAIAEDRTVFVRSISGAGLFNILVPTRGSWRLEIRLDEGCSMYHHVDGAVSTEDAASLLVIADDDLTGVDVVMPNGACTRQIRGRAVRTDGRGVVDAWLWAATDQDAHGQTHTDVDGSFAVTVPVPGAYVLRLWVPDGCYVYYNESAEASAQYAARVAVGDADVTDIVIRLSENPCG